MSIPADGGPAFPVMLNHMEVSGSSEVVLEHQGMSLRDYFAAVALQGLLANSFDSQAQTYAPPDFDRIINTATRAYLYADEMLKARSQPQS